MYVWKCACNKQMTELEIWRRARGAFPTATDRIPQPNPTLACGAKIARGKQQPTNIAPHHSTPHHSTVHHTTAHHSTAHHHCTTTTPHHTTTAHHTTAQYTTPQHTTAQHTTVQHTTATASCVCRSRQTHKRRHDGSKARVNQRTHKQRLSSASISPHPLEFEKNVWRNKKKIK